MHVCVWVWHRWCIISSQWRCGTLMSDIMIPLHRTTAREREREIINSNTLNEFERWSQLFLYGCILVKVPRASLKMLPFSLSFLCRLPCCNAVLSLSPLVPLFLLKNVLLSFLSFNNFGETEWLSVPLSFALCVCVCEGDKVQNQSKCVQRLSSHQDCQDEMNNMLLTHIHTL